MRKLLVFDADKSLGAISDDPDYITEVFGGIPPLPCSDLENFYSVMQKLVEAKLVPTGHPAFTDEESPNVWRAVLNEKAQKLGLYGVAVDTMSHMGRVTFRNISYMVHKEKHLNEVASIDRGVYLQYRDYGNRILNMIKMISFPFIVNVHARKEDDGTIAPDFISGLRGDFGEYFDVVAYARTRKVDGELVYSWRVKKDNAYQDAKIRHGRVREILGDPDEIPQDFDLLLSAYEETNYKAPKILIIAPTSQGKTSALATVNGYYPPQFTKKELITNGKAN